jgi:RimJ/RimL family protein N-acetyltransferase
VNVYHTLIPLFDSLRGDRVLLRPYQPEDAPALFEAVQESRKFLLEWIGFPVAHQSPEQSRDWVAKQGAKWLLREDLSCGVWEAGSGRYLGDCRLYPQNWDIRCFSFSYWLRVSAGGKGYMTEAVRLWSDYALSQLGANRLEIRCDERNRASAAVAERAGFTLEGRLRNQIATPKGKLGVALIYGRVPE